MQELSAFSLVSLYVMMVMMGILALVIWDWQIKVLRGRVMKNPDGSSDNWRAQKSHYGIALADTVLACPATLIGITLVFLSPRWGFYMLALVSFWGVWANIMTTATSLRFEKPVINLTWFFTFPFSALLGLLYIIWTIVHFETIYFN